MKLLSGQNINPEGETGGDGISKTHDFLKDVDIHMIKLLTVKIEGDNPEQITFNIILGSNAQPILGSQYTSPQNIHVKHTDQTTNRNVDGRRKVATFV